LARQSEQGICELDAERFWFSGSPSFRYDVLRATNNPSSKRTNALLASFYSALSRQEQTRMGASEACTSPEQKQYFQVFKSLSVCKRASALVDVLHLC
jgi:hypothetical protein